MQLQTKIHKHIFHLIAAEAIFYHCIELILVENSQMTPDKTSIDKQCAGNVPANSGQAHQQAQPAHRRGPMMEDLPIGPAHPPWALNSAPSHRHWRNLCHREQGGSRE